MSPTRVRVASRLLVLATLLVLPSRAAAQNDDRRLGLRAFVSIDSTTMFAEQTFDTVLGSSRFASISGGGEVLGLWRGLFLRVAASRTTRVGERAIVFEGRGYRVGIEQRITLAPLEVGGGWRVDPGRRGGIAFYGGGGLLYMRYQERSPIGPASEDVERGAPGGVVFGGVDYTVFRVVMVGAEAQVRSIRGVLGEGGVSRGFDEHDLGGTTLRALVGIHW